MRQYLTSEEFALKVLLKEHGVLIHVVASAIKKLFPKGLVSFFCGDGDRDMRSFHHKVVTSRPHLIALFGGINFLARFFAKYKRCFSFGIMENIELGFEAKETQDLGLGAHWPCSGLMKYGHTMADSLRFILEAIEEVDGRANSITVFYHVKKMVDDKIEENTYLLDVEKPKLFMEKFPYIFENKRR